MPVPILTIDTMQVHPHDAALIIARELGVI
jgi:hypothetical protein